MNDQRQEKRNGTLTSQVSFVKLWGKSPVPTPLIPKLQFPFASEGCRIKSVRSIGNSWPPNLRAMLVLVLQGTVNEPSSAKLEPGILFWMIWASDWGSIINVVPMCIFHLILLGRNKHVDNPPVSRVADRPVSIKSWPFMMTVSMLHSQNPDGLMLGRVIKVLESNLFWSNPLERNKN